MYIKKLMNLKTRKIIIITIAVCLFVGIFINYFVNSYHEYNNAHNFKITHIKTSKGAAIVLYSGNEKVIISNYRLSKYHNIQIGDSISKAKRERYLCVYRKDNSNEFQLISKEVPNGLFGGLWSYK